MYLEGLNEDPEVPFTRERSAPARGADGPVKRKAVVASVIDIDAMRAELDGSPDARKRV